MSDLFSKSRPVTSTQTTTLPQWLTDASKANINSANNLPGYSPFTGESVANLTPAQLQALGLTMGNAGRYGSTIDGAIGGANNAMGFQAPNVTAAGVGGDASALMNPYTSNVIDANNSELERQRQKEMLTNDATAQRFKAFGTDNHALMDTETNRNFDATRANTTAGLLSSGWQDALQKALAIGQGNQGAAISGAGINLQGANTAGNLAQTGAGINTGDVQGLLTAGGVQQGNQQQRDTFNYGEHMNQYNSLLQQLQARIQATSSAPHDTTQTTQSQQYYSPLGQIAGLGLGIAGLGMGGPLMAGIGGLAGSAAQGLGLFNPAGIAQGPG